MEPIKSKSPLFAGGPFVRYRMDPVDHPVYGKATFCGDIPLLLPYRGRTQDEILPDLPDCEGVVQALMELGRTVWADEDDEGVLLRLRAYTFSCAIMSGMRPADPRFLLFVEVMVLFIAVDDELDGVEDPSAAAGSYTGVAAMFRDPDDDPVFDRPIPGVTGRMARILEHWDGPGGGGLKQKLLEVPDFRAKYSVALRQEIYLFAASHVVKSEVEAAGHPFSASTTWDLLRNIASPAIVTEFVAIMRDAIIPDYVRSDVFFHVARDKVSDVEMLVNALLGLPRDLRRGQTDSPIMADVVSGRRSLQEAIDKGYDDLCSALHDLRLATDLLLKTYPDNEEVKTYVHIMVGGMDGWILTHKFHLRYRIMDNLTIFEK